MATLLRLPSSLNERTARGFCLELSACPDVSPLVIDVGNIRWAFPFGSLVIASQVRRLRGMGREIEFQGFDTAKSSHTYLAHVGFFRLMGYAVGNEPGAASGGDTYLPYTVLSHNDLKMFEFLGDESVHRAIQRQAEQLAAVFTQSKQLKVTRPISYCIRELVRNVFEHAATDECIIGGQAYKDGRVQIGIVDYGRGLLASLSERYSLPNDIEAIKMAIKPGITRATEDGSDDPWANSGFGLYVLSRLGARAGYFSLMSGTSMLYLDGNAAGMKESSLHGTAVNLLFSRPHGQNLEELLERIIEEGEAITKREGKPRKASGSSRTIA